MTKRKKVPRYLAVIDIDRCTGCEACVAVCPVDCIETIHRGHGIKGTESWCEIDWDECIGCRLCIRIPQSGHKPYVLDVCPWEAIEMVATETVAEQIDDIGGPAGYLEENRSRLIAMAQRQSIGGVRDES